MGQENMPQNEQKNEQSGSHQLSLPAHVSNNGGSIDIKTLIVIVMGIVGVGGGATGITTGLGGSDKIDALATEVRELRLTVEKRSETDVIYRNMITDLDKRVRVLEKKVPD